MSTSAKYASNRFTSSDVTVDIDETGDGGDSVSSVKYKKLQLGRYPATDADIVIFSEADQNGKVCLLNFKK